MPLQRELEAEILWDKRFISICRRFENMTGTLGNDKGSAGSTFFAFMV